MLHIQVFFPRLRGYDPFNECNLPGVIISIKRCGLCWRHAPGAFGPRKALRDQFLHWSRMSVFATVFQEPAQAGNQGMTPMIDITFLKAYRNKSARKMVTQKRSGAPEAA